MYKEEKTQVKSTFTNDYETFNTEVLNKHYKTQQKIGRSPLQVQHTILSVLGCRLMMCPDHLIL